MQQQTNFFTPTQKHLIQLHGFPNITDIIYVKPLYSVRSLVVYPSLILLPFHYFTLRKDNAIFHPNITYYLRHIICMIDCLFM